MGPNQDAWSSSNPALVPTVSFLLQCGPSWNAVRIDRGPLPPASVSCSSAVQGLISLRTNTCGDPNNCGGLRHSVSWAESLAVLCMVRQQTVATCMQEWHADAWLPVTRNEDMCEIVHASTCRDAINQEMASTASMSHSKISVHVS